jgi:uncharacterized protein (TIGR00251 family)
VRRVAITVVPGARRTSVEPAEDGRLRVAVPAPPREGRANEAVIAALAAYFRVPRSQVRIVFGRTARRKIVEISGEV